MRIIEELWYGNIEPTEYDTIACKEYKEVLRLITRNEEKLLATFDELNRKIQQTAGSLCAQFEQDYLRGVESLFREHFDEYRVYLDFIADKLGMSPAIREKAQEIYDSLSDDMRQQVLAYQNGARNSFWMINRSNLKYIVDNDLISLIPSE